MKKIGIGLAMLLLLGTNVQAQTYEVIDQISIQSKPFVQGFELLDEDSLIIGTGLYGESLIQVINLDSMQVEKTENLDRQVFGEGITLSPQGIWQFTWREGLAFLRDSQSLEILETFNYQGEGWGMAYDSDRQVIWTSDGSNQVTARSSIDFQPISQLEIFNSEGTAVENINELEYADGFLYANVWQTNQIMAIDPQNGNIIATWDLSELVEELDFEDQDPNRVLNGIAHIKNNEFYVSGKRFPVIWHLRLNQ